MSQPPVTETDLHEYVDGALPASRRAQVEHYLGTHADAAERVRAYQRIDHDLRAHFEPMMDEPVPQRLIDAAAAPVSEERKGVTDKNRGGNGLLGGTHPWAQRIAASIAIASIGAAGGWMARGNSTVATIVANSTPSMPYAQTGDGSLPRQAAIAHVVYSPDVRRPVEIGANQEDQLIAWLSKRLGTNVRPPKLTSVGYELIGGRLLPGSRGPVAQFMYQDPSGQRLTLYVTTEIPKTQPAAFRFAQEGPVNVFYWVDGKFGYAISAGIAKGKLAQVATVVYDQLK